MALPHVMTKDKIETSSAASNVTNTFMARFNQKDLSSGLCGAENHPNSLEDSCDAETGERVVDWGSLVLVFAGIVLTGVGNCAFYTFGLAYLDDNTSHENSPIMLGITYTFRLLGPTLGFMLGSFCLRTYVYPGVDPGFDETDPR